MRKIEDTVFGELIFDYGWIGSCTISIFGKNHDLRLFVPCDFDTPIEDSQYRAYEIFNSNKISYTREAEIKIFDYYLSVIEEYRARAGADLMEKFAPYVAHPSQMAALVRPTELVVQQSFERDDRIIGLLFDCTWEPDLGLAVKFVNEKINQVGVQDIVL